MKFKVKSRFVNDGDGWKREVGIKILWLNPNEPDPHEWRWMDVKSAKALIDQLDACMRKIPLVPCPFCGSDDVYYKGWHDETYPNDWGTYGPTHIIACNECGARLAGSTLADATKKWNSRGGKEYEPSD